MAVLKKERKKKLKNKRNIFYRMHKIFESNISLHEVSIDTVGSYASKYDKVVLGKFVKRIDPIIKKLKNKKKIALTDFDIDLLLSINKKHPKQSSLFAKNTLVSIVSTIDVLFAKIFEYHYTRHPETLSLENQKITFNELENIDKIEDAQKFLIAREIESLLLHNGLKERLKILSDDLGVDLVIEKDNFMKDFKKLVKIRNLIVHNEGKADDEFVRLYGGKGTQKHKPVAIETKYLTHSLSLVYFIGSYVLQEVQLKLFDNVEKDDFILNNAMHRLLENEQYDFLRPIYDYSMKRRVGDVNKKMIIINYCIGLKKQGKKDTHIKKVLDKEDWSAVPFFSNFNMALEILKGNEDSFYKILNNSIKNKTISKEELSDWALFSLCRKKTKFKNLKKKALG